MEKKGRVYVTRRERFIGRAGASGNWFSFFFILDRRVWVSLVVLYGCPFFFFLLFPLLGLSFWVFCFRYVLYPYLSYFFTFESLILCSVYGVCLSREIGGLREVGFIFLYFLFVMCMVMISGGKHGVGVLYCTE